MVSRSLKPLVWLALALVIIVGLWLTPVGASSLLTGRVNQLEVGLNRLQSQVNQIQSQLRLGNSPGGNRPAAPALEPLPGDPSLAAQFDNLAILAIELRDRITALETRVTELERRAEST